MRRLLALVLCGALLLSGFPAAAQLVGTDTAPGASCAGFPTGATRMTADADLDGGSVVLICDGTVWQAMSGGGGGGGLVCPSGFTKVQKLGNTLGCIKDTVIGPSSCQAAITTCWNTYGARLPTYPETRAAVAEGAITVTVRQWTGEASYTGANGGCGTADADGSPDGWTHTNSYSFRCFIPTGANGGGGDNLGNHTATTNIQLGANYLSGDGGSEGVSVDAAGNVTVTGDLTAANDFYTSVGGAAHLVGTVMLENDISPTSLGASQNNYNPANLDLTSVVRLTASTPVNITGLAGGLDGRVITLMNVGANTITLVNASASSTAANRFAINADMVVGADQSVSLIYDAISQRWRSASFPFSSSPRTGYFVLTSTTYNGNLGAFSGANAKCLTELTTNTTWKYYTDASSAGLLDSTHVMAFLCYDLDLSGACQNLSTNTTYYFARVGSATDGGASFTTDSTYGRGPNDSANWSGATYFNGSYTYWTARYNSSTLAFPESSDSMAGDCVGWSSSSSGQTGDDGTSNATDVSRWVTASPACNTTRQLICAVNP